MAVIAMIVFKPPRKLVIMGLDRVKCGHVPIVVKFVADTLFVVMIVSVYIITITFQKRWINDGNLNPTDVVLLSKHFREVIMGLCLVKCGHGPIVVKTVAGTVFVVMISSVYSIMNIQKRWIDDGDLNPTDQVLLSKQLLEASLMGIIDEILQLLYFKYTLTRTFMWFHH
ncbi:B-cell receptor-associated protein 31-like protein [Actinidia rufa]|uniref:Endoplasmic reticulum transmembrane protein n=1 Tax=Actinidia rufa TaxID=165716 RepID=A0A7J0DML7_9ERIC|nr:B-cell receptor-associated protein 31-like protein [Actinidia rufa]